MLSSIKKKSKGWISYVVIALVAIPFALFGIASYFGYSSNPTIIKINGEKITASDYQRLFSQESRRIRQLLGDSYDNTMDRFLRDAVLYSLIDNFVLDEFVTKEKLQAVSEEIIFAIENNEDFYINGEFSNEAYQRFLSLRGINPISYEIEQMDLLLREQIRENVLISNFITKAQVKQLQDLNNQQREVSYIVIKHNDFVNQVKLDADELLEYYENNKEQFIIPEQVKVSFVELSSDNIKVDDNFTEDDLLSIYDERISASTDKQTRRAQHILVEDKDLAESLLKEIKDGADFAKLAKEHSIDTTTKDNSGDLGYFERGVMVPEFEKAAFALEVGELSEVVKSDYGYHIIRLNYISDGGIDSFDDMREDLIAVYKEREKNKQFDALQEDFANSAYEKTIEELAADFSLEVKTSEFFAANSQLYDQNFIDASFSDFVLDGENSDVFKVDNNLVVVSLLDRITAKQKTFTESENEIKDIVIATKLDEFIDNLSSKLINSLSADDGFASDFISSNNLNWSEPDWINRDSDLPFLITQSAYKMPKPNNNYVYAAQKIDDENTLLLELRGIRQAEKNDSENIGEIYLIQQSNEWMRSFTESLKNEADIKIYENRL